MVAWLSMGRGGREWRKGLLGICGWAQQHLEQLGRADSQGWDGGALPGFQQRLTQEPAMSSTQALGELELAVSYRMASRPSTRKQVLLGNAAYGRVCSGTRKWVSLPRSKLTVVLQAGGLQPFGAHGHLSATECQAQPRNGCNMAAAGGAASHKMVCHGLFSQY
uniref:Uncharacterized protein n=1 Tax=Sphaerodactylus townsendi TaxID=933632 RepID=A0ACB8E9E0_9SAUR